MPTNKRDTTKTAREINSEITIRTIKATLLSWEAILALKVDLFCRRSPQYSRSLVYGRPHRLGEPTIDSLSRRFLVREGTSKYSRWLNTFSWRFLVHWRTPKYSGWTLSGALFFRWRPPKYSSRTLHRRLFFCGRPSKYSKRRWTSQTRAVIPHLEFLPTLLDRLSLAPVSITTDRNSKWRL
jgi:hypothetical protein